MKGRPHTFAQPTIYRSINGGGFKKKVGDMDDFDDYVIMMNMLMVVIQVE